MKPNTLLPRLAVIFFGLATLLAFQVSAQKAVQPKPGSPGTWRLLGTTHASHSADHDVIVVEGPYDNFRKIEFWYETKGFLNGKADVTVFGMK